MAHLVRIRGRLAQLRHLLRVLNMILSDVLTISVDRAVVVAVLCAASILDGVSQVGKGLVRSHLLQSV